MVNEKRTKRKEKEFKPSDVVVYPLQGVGVIKNIEERKFKEKKVRYYTIYIEMSEMTIMLPVEKSKELGIRPIISKKKAESLIERIATEGDYVFSSDWKMRYQSSLEYMKAGTIFEIAKVLKAMYLRSKTKDLPIMERKLYDSSLQALIIELSLAIGEPEDVVRQMLFEKFNAANESEAEDETETEAESEAESATESESESETESATKAEAEAESKAEAEAESKAEAEN